MSFTVQQTRVFHTPGVQHVGTDAKERPVVRGMVGIPAQLRYWSVLRNGNPTDVVDPITPLDREYMLGWQHDWYICICGNDADAEGFWPCQLDGAPHTGTDWGNWDEYQYVVCGRCGRYCSQLQYPELPVLGVCSDLDYLRRFLLELH